MSAAPVETTERTDEQAAAAKVRHCACTVCYPNAGPYVALCGTPSEAAKGGGINPKVPPEACVVCLDMWRKPCLRCGF